MWGPNFRADQGNLHSELNNCTTQSTHTKVTDIKSLYAQSIDYPFDWTIRKNGLCPDPVNSIKIQHSSAMKIQLSNDRKLSTDSSEWNQLDENSFFNCTEIISQSHFSKINSVYINGGREGSYQDPAENQLYSHTCVIATSLQKMWSVVKPGRLSIRRLPPPTAAQWTVNSLTGRLAEGLRILVLSDWCSECRQDCSGLRIAPVSLSPSHWHAATRGWRLPAFSCPAIRQLSCPAGPTRTWTRSSESDC